MTLNTAVFEDPAVSNTEAAGGLHAPTFDEFLENNGEHEFVRAQDKVMQF